LCDDEEVKPAGNGSLLTNVACLPISLSAIPAKLSTKIRVCQVCKYEMRRLRWKSVTLCPKHGVHLCTEPRKPRQECSPQLVKEDGSPVTDWSWTCQTTDSCWNKFHNFYQPHGLFNNNFSLAAPNKCKFAAYVYTSTLYQNKYAALGIQVKLKSGRVAGMGKINERLHVVNPKKEEEHKENYSSNDEDVSNGEEVTESTESE
jgi:hypothetical protein